MNRNFSKKRWGQPRSKSAPAMVVRSPKNRKQWSEASMVVAIESMKNGTAVLRAAREHGCTSTPSSTKTCPCTPASQTGPAVTPRQSSSVGDLRYISKYLVLIVPSATPNRPKQSAMCISGACSLVQSVLPSFRSEKKTRGRKRKEGQQKERKRAEKERERNSSQKEGWRKES